MMTRSIIPKMLSALALMFLCASVAPALEFVRSARADLDADGTNEAISLEVNEEDGSFLLEIEGVSVKGSLDPWIEGFAVLDVNTHDSFKEIAVYTCGPSSDDCYLIYGYGDGKITLMGRLERWPTFTGYGIVYVDDWMGFWRRTDKYVLDKEARELKLVPQEFHYVGVSATVAKSIPIHSSRGEESVLANLRTGSEATILLYWGGERIGDDDDSYLIKSATGLLGWVNHRAIHANFSGIGYAD